MSDATKIEWADATFNPWVGCTKVSPACDHCYAEAWAKRSGMVQWGNAPRRRTSEGNWRKPLKWDREAAERGEPFRVFCASLADVFDNRVPPGWRRSLWDMIARTPHLTWMLLTKRPQNIRNMLPDSYGDGTWGGGWPNVWLGTTAENQEEADRRIPALLSMPAAVRFISAEPLLGPVVLPMGLDWVIAGGESGPGARDMDPAWARSIRDQCATAGTAFFMKQMARKAPIPDDLMVRQWPGAEGKIAS